MGGLVESVAADAFMEAFAYAQRGTAIRAILGRFKFLHRDQKWWRACKDVTDYLDTCVDAALDRQQNNEGRVIAGSKVATISTRLRLVDEMARDSR
jgi:cytochrome P450 monooxygenase